MRRFFLTLSLFLGLVGFTNAQSLESRTLMSIAGEDISVKEFLRVYNKNIDLVQDQNLKNIDHYLDLYINYKLKLKEAKALGYDQKDSYKKEFKGYKNQLSKAYTTDTAVTQSLVKEAYDRTTNEVKAQHVLVRTLEGNDPKTAYDKIQLLRPRFIAEDFSDLRRSLHDGKAVFVEDLGYFSAFKMVYDFENAAFNTPVGQTSEPFKTQFGYHIVKVLDKRPSKGKVQVAHIMISNTQKDSTIVPEKRIKELYGALLQGGSFESLAKQFSDDKSSAAKGGVMNAFKSGDINSEIFVETAFNLEEIGDISEPIQTRFGWHILKLISKTAIESFDKISASLEQKVKRDSRSRIIRDKMIEKLKLTYQLSEPNLAFVGEKIQMVNSDIAWILSEDVSEQSFLTIESKTYSYKDFINHLNKNAKSFQKSKSKSQFISEQYAVFLADNLFRYKKDNLINDNPEYANILKEYEEGLLLFDIMQDKIWDGAKSDSLGLKAHYESNISSFKSEEKISGTIVSSNSKKYLKLVEKLWSKGLTDEAISNQINKTEQVLIFSNGEFELSSPLLPKNTQFSEGVSEIYKLDSNFVILKVSSLLPANTLLFEDAKGMVISDYQSTLEANWIEELRKQYPLVIDSKVLKMLKSRLGKK